MKKLLVCCIFALMVMCSATWSQAQENPLNQLTGAVWLSSSEENKKALLYGVECAISMEYSVVEHMAKKAGKPTDEASLMQTLTPFARNWIRAFKHSTRNDIVNELDAWFTSHTDAQDEPVFKVLWKEIMQPKLTTR